MKFNTDGASKGSCGAAGIGGLRNHCGKALIYFFKVVTMSDPTSAEILAVQEACRLFSLSLWFRSYRLILECDSKLVTDWMSNPQSAPEVSKPVIMSCLKFYAGLQ
ncbi:hypothetical protein V6N11_079202 [Hibiscus sabdariffa]|uniref:RNase H type-1 domain-containing protein n=1 Tax=Hibiscus sabdariffa TaxID=183260 RepID=A0ABR2RUQ9_9ROSI